MSENKFQQIMIELFKELKDDIRSLKIDMNKRFKQSDKRLERIEDKQEIDRNMLQKIYHSRNQVTAKVTWDFIWKATAFNAVVLILVLMIFKASLI